MAEEGRSGRATPSQTCTLAVVANPLVELVEQARRGDASAWAAIVERLKGVVWRATAAQGLSSEDRQDVFAATFFRLFEHLGTIREPAKLPGWVATTARNESRQMMRSRWRVELRAEFEPSEPVTSFDIAEGLLDDELRVALGSAFQRLGGRCQELLRLSTAVPAVSYDEISQITGIARNSLGPTRHRCLERLRQTPELQPFLEGARS
jgi:RNA polymerase sigma factor (sigma-70 family)